MARADRRAERAAERILDAAERLFTAHNPASVGMHEIARAAGCSRATLYRYFESREALHAAYVRRWANALYRQLTDNLSGIDDPHQRLITGITESLALVRNNPALASWFAETGPPIGVELAERSEVVTAMVAVFLAALGPGEADERAMLEEFVVPVVAGTDGGSPLRPAPPRLRPPPADGVRPPNKPGP